MKWDDKNYKRQIQQYTTKTMKKNKVMVDMSQTEENSTQKPTYTPSPISLKNYENVFFFEPTIYSDPVIKGKNPRPQPSKYASKNPPNIHWDEIGGLEQAKQDLQEAIELPYQHASLHTFYNKQPIKGILLSGPPGCGKTMLGKAAATSLAKLHKQPHNNSGFIYLKGPEILNCYLGETEKAIRQIFTDAKAHYDYYKYPAILFIDEAESILSARGHSFIPQTIVPQFLTEMDGLEASSTMVILATNRPDMLDPAIIRDGRIDRKIHIDRPSEDTARHILALNLRHVPTFFSSNLLIDEAITLLYSHELKIPGQNVWLRDLITGAMLANLINLSVSFAMHRDIQQSTRTGITLEDIRDAVTRLHQSVTI